LEESVVEFQMDVKNVLDFAEENWDKVFQLQLFEKIPFLYFFSMYRWPSLYADFKFLI